MTGGHRVVSVIAHDFYLIAKSLPSISVATFEDLQCGLTVLGVARTPNIPIPSPA
jgi:hypothetical protein